MDAAHQKLLLYFAVGAVSAVIGSMTKTGRITLPRLVVEKDEDGSHRKIIDPGFFTSALLGGALAMYFDVRVENSIAWGLAAGYAGPPLLKAFTDAFLKRIGFTADPPLSNQLPANLSAEKGA